MELKNLICTFLICKRLCFTLSILQFRTELKKKQLCKVMLKCANKRNLEQKTKKQNEPELETKVFSTKSSWKCVFATNV